jgi:hypothetical protein
MFNRTFTLFTFAGISAITRDNEERPSEDATPVADDPPNRAKPQPTLRLRGIHSPHFSPTS